MDIEKKKYFIENFSSSTQLTLDKIFQRGLYEITPINRALNKNFLSLAYTPGVASVCTQIQKNLELVNQLTLRGRSVAVVTQGNCFKDDKIQPGKMMPIVDWCISQIKFYSNVDCYPFIIRQNANLMNVFKDIANAYGAILFLDTGLVFNTQQLPHDVALIKQQDICNINGKPSTDCEDTAKILAYVLANKIRGIIGQNILKEGIKFKPNPFKKQSAYFILYRDEKSIQEKALDFHKKFSGKIQIELNFENIQQLKKYFTPQNLLQYVQSKIKKRGFQQISAIVTNATAILGLGDIGPKAGLPVMEGKSLLFKILGGTNVVPICINKRETYQQTIEAILDIASFFRALNLEDIKSPDCFYIEKFLKQKKVLPIFHDDQHGTAIVTLAALINALKVAQKTIDHIKVVICGVGAAGIAICKLLLKHGVKNVIMSDTKGAIYDGRQQNMNQQKQKLAQITNPQKIKGSLADIIKGADVFIGVSKPGAMKTQWVKLMNERPIVFAMANPDPQITFDDAIKGGAFIYGSGRSDFKNQINNSLVFPGVFRGIHQHNLQQITEQMEQFVAILIAKHIDKKPTQKHIIVDSLDLDIPVLISNGLAKFKTKVEGAKL